MVGGAGIKSRIEESSSDILLKSHKSTDSSPGRPWRGSFGPVGSVQRLREGSVNSKSDLFRIEDVDDEDYNLIDQELTRFAEDLHLKDNLIEKTR